MAGRALVDVPMVLRIGILEILGDVVNLPNYGESKVGEGVGLEGTMRCRTLLRNKNSF
jgi:hypothetical protein